MPSFLLILSIATLLIAIGGVVFTSIILSFVFVGDLKGAPYVRSARERIQTMLEIANPKINDVITDLGSGDGTLLLESARRGAHTIGIEVNPFLVWYARLRARKHNLPNAAFVCGDFLRAPLPHETTIVFLYLLPKTLELLKEKIKRELLPGTRVISNAFQIPGWTPILKKENVYLYEV